MFRKTLSAGKNCTRNINMGSDEDMGTPRISTQMKKKKPKVKDIQLSAQVHALPSSPPVTGKPDLYKLRERKLQVVRTTVTVGRCRTHLKKKERLVKQ